METRQDSLSAYVAKHGHSKYDWYFPFYDEALRDHEVTRLLEIGCSARSLQTWLDCFPEAEIVGLDMSPRGPTNTDDIESMGSERLQFVVGDQTDEDLLIALGSFDVVIDDGGHHSHQQIKSFCTLFPLMPSGGWYFIEDIHCSYMPGYQDESQTTMSFLGELLDDMNGRYHPHLRDQVWPIAEIRFADSIVALRKT